MRLTNRAILFFILIVATALRLFNYFEIPYTHDEFSALFRTNFDSFSELIEKGVKPDGHPAGIQVFLYYWTIVFGKSEWVVKLPFAAAGILSVYLIYLIGKKWYNETTGLISAAFMASLQFAVMYSQISRPYISGLFFSLLMVNFWTNLIHNRGKQFYKNSLLFIISASLCAYNHYFSLLFAAIVGVSGLFLIEKQFRVKYIALGVIIVLTFIPHYKIFLYQLEVGGVEAWLGKPNNDFIFNYIEYLFNFSILSATLVLTLFLLGIYQNIGLKMINRKMILSICWFFLPFVIGFIYSKYFQSVLQYSVLIFSSPYLLFILFGHLKPQKEKINLLIIFVILSVNVFSLTIERDHYNLFYNSPYIKLLTDFHEVKHSNNKVLGILDSNEKITKHYLKKNNLDSNFTRFISFSNEKDLIKYLKTQSLEHDSLFFGCVSSNNPITIPIIQDYYPRLLWQKNYAGGTSYLFGKEKKKDDNVIAILDFDSGDSSQWNSVSLNKYIDSAYYSGRASYLIDHDTEWGPSYSNKLENVIVHKNNFIDVSVKVKSEDRLEDIILVTSFESDGESVYWSGTSFDTFYLNTKESNAWISVHHSVKLSDVYLNYSNIVLNVFVWNKGKRTFLIDDFKIKIRKGNPVIYGLYEKIN